MCKVCVHEVLTLVVIRKGLLSATRKQWHVLGNDPRLVRRSAGPRNRGGSRVADEDL